MLFTFLLAGVLLLPGYLICRLAGIREYGFLIAITISYCCFLLLATIGNRMGIGAFTLLYWYLGLATSLVALLGFVSTRRQESSRTGFPMLSPTLMPGTLLAVLGFISIYHLLFGVYNEVPADLYEHIRFAGHAYLNLHSGKLDFEQLQLSLFQRERVWHELVGWVAFVTGSEIIDVYPYASIVSIMLFSVSFLLLADRTIQPLAISRPYHQLVLILAILFMFVQLGLDSFSYVRYYSFAPSMVNFCLFFTGVVCVLNLFEKKGSTFVSLLLLVLSVSGSYFIHQQEALFIVITFGLMLIWYLLFWCWKFRNGQPLRLAGLAMALLALFVVVVLGYLHLRGEHDIFPFDHNKLIHFPFHFPVFGKLYILNPSYQFLDVVTVWGLFVYLMFAIYFRRYLDQPLLIVLMLSPLVTVFNPFFSDLFIRVVNSITLWRLSYLIPLHIVAALSVYFLLTRWRQAGALKKCGSVAALALLILLLLPGIGPLEINANARTSLAAVKFENSVDYWADMIEAVEQIEGEHAILTDPISGYLVSAFTHHHAYQKKFLPTWAYYRNTFLFDSYDDFPLDRYSGHLLLINRRNGGYSINGERSHHWHPDVLRLTDYYSEALLSHVESHPDRFDKLWTGPDISLYLIK